MAGSCSSVSGSGDCERGENWSLKKLLELVEVLADTPLVACLVGSATDAPLVAGLIGSAADTPLVAGLIG